MTKDEFIAQAVIAGKTRAQALTLYAEAFPAVDPAPGAVVGFCRQVSSSGRVIETEILGDGSQRITKDAAP